jgi:dTDP-4-dehydrorhamnose reductase
MKVLIIGGSGLVGGNIQRCFAEQEPGWEVVGTHRSFATSTTLAFDPCLPLFDWPSYISDVAWDVIIHTGALTHVDRCETEPEASYLQTVVSTENLVEFAKQKNSRLVYISSDYVFDGKLGPYSEACAVNPVNVYGKHKLLAEKLVEEACSDTGYLIIRITNVYGKEERAKNYVLRTLAQVNDGMTSFTAPYDQYATPINASDIGGALLLLIKNKKTGIYHLASTDYLSRVQLLERISKSLNKIINIKSVSTSELDQPALRPLKGGLFAQKFLSEFPGFAFTNLDDFLRNNII